MGVFLGGWFWGLVLGKFCMVVVFCGFFKRCSSLPLLPKFSGSSHRLIADWSDAACPCKTLY